MECSSGRTKKATYFINNKGNNLRHWCWLYCLSSKELVAIGATEVLLHPLSSLAQACNIHIPLKNAMNHQVKTWGEVAFLSFLSDVSPSVVLSVILYLKLNRREVLFPALSPHFLATP